MEVTHLSHETTHAVIGGLAPEAFEVKANAEFFEMLSSTMYPNQKLAVVREVLCNSWDAHLMVGKADTAVEVTITDKEMSFRDFGPGISRDKIIQIYCTYGGSTKTHDGVQTGGFGLGSKSPFAYSKHFTVVSCHDGKRTIYAASRGSAETQGRPDFRPMVADLPTTETGITVTIPLMSPVDKRKFERLVKDLAYLGGMNVKLNGDQLKRLDWSKVELPFAALPSRLIGEHHGEQDGLYVRYGAVVYPVNISDERISVAFSGAKMLHRAVNMGAIILVAPPNSLSVAPSRETLTYNERTQDCIINLIKQAERAFDDHRPLIAKCAVKIATNAVLGTIAPFTAHFRLSLAVRGLKESVYGVLYDAVVSNRGSRGSFMENQQAKAVMTAFAQSALSAYNINQSALRDLMNDMPEQDVFAHIAKTLRSKRKGCKKIFNRLDVMTIGRHDGDRYGRVSYDYNDRRREAGIVMSSLERLAKRSEGFGVRFEFCARQYGNLQAADVNTVVKGLIGPLFERKYSDEIETMKISDAKPVVIIAPSITSASRCIEKNKGKSWTKGSRYILARCRKSSDIEGLTKFLEKARYTVVDARDYVLKRERPKASENTYMVEFVKDSPTKTTIRPRLDEDKPDCYCYGELLQGEEEPTLKTLHVSKELRKWAIERGLNVALVENATDARIATKAGLRSIFDLFSDEIEQVGSTVECLSFLVVEGYLSDVLPLRLENVVAGLGKDQKSKNIAWAGVLSVFGINMPSFKADDAFINALISYLNTDRNSKYGASAVYRAITALNEKAKTVFADVIEVCEMPGVSSALNDFDYYAANRAGPVIALAVIRTILEVGRVQNALQKATNTTTTTTK